MDQSRADMTLRACADARAVLAEFPIDDPRPLAAVDVAEAYAHNATTLTELVEREDAAELARLDARLAADRDESTGYRVAVCLAAIDAARTALPQYQPGAYVDGPAYWRERARVLAADPRA